MFMAHTAYHRLVVSDLGPENLQESLADIWREDRPALLLDRWRLGNLELTHIVKVDQGIVCKGHVDRRTGSTHGLYPLG
jgi:hypothetical protein